MPLLNPTNEEVLEECSNLLCRKQLPPSGQYMASLGGDFMVFCVDCFAEIEVIKLRTSVTEYQTLAEIYV